MAKVENNRIENQQPKKPIRNIVIASTSPRRVDFIRHAFPEVRLFYTSGGEEDQTASLTEISQNKADFALRTMTRSAPIVEPHVIISADAKQAIMQSENKIFVGKPDSKQALAKTFRLIRDAERGDVDEPRYFISAGSTLISNDSTGVRNESSLEETEVVLDKKSVKDFTEEAGVDSYLMAFENFRFPAIGDISLEKDINLGSGGLDLGTLTRMGSVKSIDGVPFSDTPEFRRALKKAFYLAHAGFSPATLQELIGRENALKAINTWPWLNSLVEEVFRLEKKPVMSFVIPIFNDTSISGLLDNLTKCTQFEESEVIIVRNGNPPQEIIEMTCEFASKHSNVKVIECAKLGIAPGRNAGFVSANADIVANLDSDVVINESFIEQMLKAAEENPTAEIFVPNLFRDPGQTLLQALTAHHFDLLNARTDKPVHNPGIVMKKAAFGGPPFDERLTWGEDSEFAHRTNGRNHVLHVPEATVLHRADSDKKILKQQINYGRDKSTISRIHAEHRQIIYRQKLLDSAFIPRYNKYRELGKLMAAYEGLIGMLFSMGFWAQEIRYMLGKDTLPEQYKE